MENIKELEDKLRNHLLNVRNSCLERGYYFLRHPTNLPSNQVLREYKDRVELWEVNERSYKSELLNTMSHEQATSFYNNRG